MTKHKRWEQNVALEPYETVRELVEGAWRTGSRMTCTVCGAMRVKWNDVKVPVDQVTKKFLHDGWDIRGRGVTCPDCVAKRQARLGLTKSPPPAMKSAAQIRAERAPRKASDALNDAFVRASRNAYRDALVEIRNMAIMEGAGPFAKKAQEVLDQWA